MKRKGIWAIVSVLVALGLILGACAKAPAAEKPAAPAAPAAPAVEKPAPPKLIKWRAQIGAIAQPTERLPGLHNTVNDTYYWKYVVEKMFPGRFELEIAPGGSIVPEAELFTAVSKGVLEISPLWPGFYTAIIPEFKVLQGLPFAWQEPGEVHDANEHFGMKGAFEEIYGEHNIQALVRGGGGSLQGMGGYTFMANSLEDFKGKKIRAVGVWQYFFQDVGATAVQVSYQDMYMALKLGTIQGVMLSVPLLDTIKAKEVLKSWVIYPNSSDYNSAYGVNKDALNALPDDIRQFILSETTHIIAYYGVARTWVENRWRAAQAEKDGYIKQILWSEEEAQKAREIGFKQWEVVAKENPRSARLVELVKRQMRAMGRMK